MLKFLRTYQKWMLVIFAAVLMGAFLLQPVISILYPDPTKRTVATIFDGQEIKQLELNRAQNDLQNLAQLGILQPGVAPLADSESDRVLGWYLQVQAARNAGLIASQNEAFTLLASTQEGINTVDDLDTFATEFGQPREYLLQIARDYLIAEQYRQLVTGIEYRSTEGLSASPGLARLQRMGGLFDNEQQMQMQIARDVAMLSGQGDNPFMAYVDPVLGQRVQQLMQIVGQFEVAGMPRISAPLLAYATQRQFAQTGGQVVVLDSEPIQAGISADPERMQQIFDEFKNVRSGTGQPYGLGYRIPDRAMAEAIRIDADQVRKLAEAEVGPEQVRAELDRNRAAYAMWQPPVEEPEQEAEGEAELDAQTEQVDPVDPIAPADSGGEGAGQPDPNQGVPPQDAAPDAAPEAPADAEADAEAADDAEPADDAADEPAAEQPEAAEPPAPLTTIDNDPAKMIQLRELIRVTLVEMRTRELVVEIARAVREELDAEARRLPEVGGYRELPADYQPMPLQDVAQRVAERFSTDEVTIELTVIPAGDQWIDPGAARDADAIVRRRVAEMDKVRVLSPQQGRINYQQVPVGPFPGPIAEPEPGEDGEIDEDAPQGPATPRHGLLASQTLDPYTINGQQQPLNLITYFATAKSLRDADNPAVPRTGLQIGVPSRIMVDQTGSAYVFRLTETDPAHAPASLAEVQEQVREDTVAVLAYEALLDRKEELLEQAKAGNLYDITDQGTSVQTLENFTMFNPPVIEGVNNVGPILEAVADLVEDLREQGQLSGASDADRTIAVELPREKKLVIFKLSAFDTLSRQRYEAEARKDWVQALAGLSALSETSMLPLSVLTIEELKKLTDFAWADDYQPDASDAGAGVSEDE